MYAGQHHLLTTTPEEAVAPLVQGVLVRDAVIVLTGPAGAGKSAVLEQALRALSDRQIRIVRIGNPGPGALGPRQLMAAVLGEDSLGRSTDNYIRRLWMSFAVHPARKANSVLAIEDA